MPHIRRDKQQLNKMVRAEKVRSLRLAGFSYQAIADKLDVSISTVRSDLEKLKTEYPQQTTRELTAEQNAKLVEMMKPQFLKACSGDHRAANTMLKLLDHQAKLWGLYNAEQDNGMQAAGEMLGALIESINLKATPEATAG